MATHHEEMEATWGRAATHAEYHVDDRICYIVEGQSRTGTTV